MQPCVGLHGASVDNKFEWTVSSNNLTFFVGKNDTFLQAIVAIANVQIKLFEITKILLE